MQYYINQNSLNINFSHTFTLIEVNGTKTTIDFETQVLQNTTTIEYFFKLRLTE